MFAGGEFVIGWNMKILIVGDIVGAPGRKVFAEVTERLRKAGRIDFVVVNAENAAGGRGITPKLVTEILESGADILTMGDHVWDQKELIPTLSANPHILRPANLPPTCPGKGCVTIDTPVGTVTLINLLGRVFLPATADCPFRYMDSILAPSSKDLGKIIIVDLHAEATSEKIAMGWHLDGRVSVLVGTHTHVQTSDERILPKGTAYITDLGMTGSKDSVLGRDKESVLFKFLTGMPSRFKVASNDLVLEGVIVDIDHNTGKARSIERVRESEERP